MKQSRNAQRPTVAGTTEGKHRCAECNRGFDTEHGLRLHKIKAHNAPHKTTRRKSSHKQQKAHTVDLAFCPVCGTNLRLLAQAMAAIEGLNHA